MPARGPMAAEVWRSELPIERGVDGPIAWSRTSELLAGALVILFGGVDRAAGEADESERSDGRGDQGSAHGAERSRPPARPEGWGRGRRSACGCAARRCRGP